MAEKRFLRGALTTLSIFITAFVLGAASPRSASAQGRGTEGDFEQWFQLMIDGNLDNVAHGLRASLDLQSRRMNAPVPSCTDGVDQEGNPTHSCMQRPNTVLIVRPAIGYSIGPYATFMVGYAYQPDFFDDPTIRAERNVQEHRIWEQYSGRFNFGRLELGTRVRVEQRFRTHGPGEGDVAHRLRIQARAAYTLRDGAPWMVIVWDEVLVHLNETDFHTEPGLDQNRAFFGLGYQASPSARIELGYLNQFVHRFTDADQVNHIFNAVVSLKFGGSHAAPAPEPTQPVEATEVEPPREEESVTAAPAPSAEAPVAEPSAPTPSEAVQ